MRDQSSWICTFLLLFGLILVGRVDAVCTLPESLAGKPVATALRAFATCDLHVVFSDRVVSPALTVAELPQPGSGEVMLRSILRAQGLDARRGPGERWIVFQLAPPRPEAGSIRGVIRHRGTSAALSGIAVAVRHGATGQIVTETSSDRAGRFELAGLPPGSYALSTRASGFKPHALPRVAVRDRRTTRIELSLELTMTATSEIVVTAPRSPVGEQQGIGRASPRVAVSDLQRAERVDDDLFRAISRLAGSSGGEDRAERLHVRGGRDDELLVVLDGHEVIEPYHLRQYGGPLSTIAPAAVGDARLHTGTVSAAFGDRMGGVLELLTAEPSGHLGTRFGAGLERAFGVGSGGFARRKGHWFASGRVARPTIAREFDELRVRPQAEDLFAKAGLQLTPGQNVRLNLLAAHDRLDFETFIGEGTESFTTDTESIDAWLAHHAMRGADLHLASVVAWSSLGRDRFGAQIEGSEDDYSIGDRRRVEQAGLRHEGWWQASDEHAVGWGLEVRQRESQLEYSFNPLEFLRAQPPLPTVPEPTFFLLTPRARHMNAWLGDRWQPTPRLELELGLRYDQHSLTRERTLSPRLALQAAVAARTQLRAGVGRFHQTQRAYELAVADGEIVASPVETTDQIALGIEHRFLRSGVRVSLDAYHRSIRDPRPRYENIWKPLSRFPELEVDRIRVAADESRARGLELAVAGTPGARFDWRLTYAFARIEDEIDGADVPRRSDRPHAFGLDLDLRRIAGFDFGLRWSARSGAPTTPAIVQAGADSAAEPWVAVPGLRNSARLPSYHRLDVFASRAWRLARFGLRFDVGIENLYDRQNVRGYDPDFGFRAVPGGGVDVVKRAERGRGRSPRFSVTVTW